MNKQTKITLAFFLALIIGLGSVLYFVSQKIDPKKLRENIISNIERSVPGHSATIGPIDYSMGVRVKIHLKDILVKSKAGAELVKIQSAEVEVPVFDILKGGGRLEVRIQRPTVSLSGQNKKEGPNLESVFGADASKAKKTAAKSSGNLAPSFVGNSRWDLKVEDLVVTGVGSEKKSYQIKKLIFKNLNLEKTTAFEIVSDFSHTFSNDRTISTQAQAVGEINIADLMDRKLEVNMLLNSEKTKLSWSETEVPALKNVIKISGSKKSNLEISLRTTGANSIDLETDLTLSGDRFEKLSLNKIESSIALKSLYTMLPSKEQEKLKNLDWKGSKLMVNGSLLYEKKKIFRPSLAFSVEGPIAIKNSLTSHAISMEGHFVGENLSAKFTDEVLDGVVTLDASTNYSPLDQRPSFIEGKLLLTSLKVGKELIQSFIYRNDRREVGGPKGKGPTEGAPTPKKSKFALFDIIVEGKHIYLNENEVNISGKIKGTESVIKSDNLLVSFGEGEMKVKANYNSDSDLEARVALKKADMKTLNALLPPFSNNLTGVFEGNIQGQFKTSGPASYTITGELEGTAGALPELDLTKVFGPVVQNLSQISSFDGEALRKANKFESLKVKGKFTEELSDVETFHLKSASGKVDLFAKGTVYNSSEKESAVKAVVSGDFYKWQKGQKKKALNFLLTGKGVRIAPQAQYTLDMLNKNQIKSAK